MTGWYRSITGHNGTVTLAKFDTLIRQFPQVNPAWEPVIQEDIDLTAVLDGYDPMSVRDSGRPDQDVLAAVAGSGPGSSVPVG